jgi:hypothetical protein
VLGDREWLDSCVNLGERLEAVRRADAGEAGWSKPR